MNLILFFNTLRSKWLSLVCLVMAGASAGYALSIVLTPQWEAESMLVPSLHSVKDNETGADMVLRLRSPLTLLQVSERVHAEQPGFDVEALRAGIRIVPNGSGVILKVRANSRELAIRISEYFLDEFNRQQDELLAVRKEQFSARKALIQREYREILKAFPVAQGGGSKSAVTFVLELNDGDLIQFPVPTTASFSIAPATLLNPVTPGPLLLIAFGASLGLCLALTRVLMAANLDAK